MKLPFIELVLNQWLRKHMVSLIIYLFFEDTSHCAQNSLLIDVVPEMDSTNACGAGDIGQH